MEWSPCSAMAPRWSISFYDETARAARPAARNDRRSNGGLGEYSSESEIRELVWLLIGDTASAAKRLERCSTCRSDGRPRRRGTWLDDGLPLDWASVVGL